MQREKKKQQMIKSKSRQYIQPTQMSQLLELTDMIFKITMKKLLKKMKKRQNKGF